MEDFDKIDNLSLIGNCLLHLQFEISRENPSYFRIAREAHLALYRSIIEALKGTANLAITGRQSRLRSHKYKRNGKPWQEIHKVPIKGCKKAWRFSQPESCEKPKFYTKTSRDSLAKDYLIGFYDALAMIQTECFMIQYVNSKIFPVSDGDMKIFEWLHEEIRNEYEHFVPKIYLSPKKDLASAAALCLKLSKMLLLESDNIIFFNVSAGELEKPFLEILNSLKGKDIGQE
jgi:hypothetical protein